MKICNGCKLERPKSDFHRKSGSQLLRHLCKPCYRADTNARYPKKGRPKRSAAAAKEGKRKALQKYRASAKGKAKHAAHVAFRRATKLNATPTWLSADQTAHIASYYELAQAMSAIGPQMDVDHIVPLNGKDVCGLHVPWNLQVMDHIENSRKNNRHET